MDEKASIIDISVPLHTTIPTWPGSKGLTVSQEMSIERGDEANVSFIACDVHTGTHIDAPRHFVQDGNTVDQVPLDTLVGMATVVDLPEVDAISAEDLQSADLPSKVDRLLFKTRNSTYWKNAESSFQEDYVALLPDAAEWLVERNVRLVGVDYLSVEPFHNEGFPTHHILLEAGIIVIEGLNLSHVKPGTYELSCLPLRLMGTEGAPARAILRPYSDQT